jgi:predicted RNA-binding protein with PUA-like domain
VAPSLSAGQGLGTAPVARWLLKSEPSAYSWDRLVAEGRTMWDGVRNHQAANNLRAMKRGDRGFFYHSNEQRAIVGVVEVVREHYPDPTDSSGRFVVVDVIPVEPVPRPVGLPAIKAEPRLADLPLVRQSRLSVSPVPDESWRLLCEMAGVKP